MNHASPTAHAAGADEAAARPFRFVLLCHQRSGSNALQSAIGPDPRIHMYGQLFSHFLEYRRRNSRHGLGSYKAHPEAMRHFGRRPPLRPRLERAVLSLRPAETSLERYTNRFWTSFGDRPDLEAVGFKLHDFQIVDAELAQLSTRHADGVVVLWRRNLLRAAVSWAYAIKTDVWSSTRNPDAPPPVHRLDPREVEWFIGKTAAEVDRWRSILTDAGARMLELTYEDDVVTRRFDRVYDFFGMEMTEPPKIATRRLSSPDYAHISNAAELDRLLSNSETGRLFD